MLLLRAIPAGIPLSIRTEHNRKSARAIAGEASRESKRWAAKSCGNSATTRAKQRDSRDKPPRHASTRAVTGFGSESRGSRNSSAAAVSLGAQSVVSSGETEKRGNYLR